MASFPLEVANSLPSVVKRNQCKIENNNQGASWLIELLCVDFSLTTFPVRLPVRVKLKPQNSMAFEQAL